MRLAPILTNETCDRRCGFLCGDCQPRERPAVAAPAALRARIDAAIADGAAELLLTGGEPTLRRDLPAIIAYIRARGPAVALATHGAHLDDAAITRLRDAGLGRVQLRLPVWGPHLDRLTRTPGAWARTFAALERLRAAAIPLDFALALTPETAPHRRRPARESAQFFSPPRRPQRPPRRSPALPRSPPSARPGAAHRPDHPAHRASPRARPSAAPRARHLHPTLSLRPADPRRPPLRPHPRRPRPTRPRPRRGVRRLRLGRSLPRPAGGAPPPRPAPAAPPAARRSPAPPPLRHPQRRRSDRPRARHPELYRRDDGQLQRATTVRIHFHCNQSCDFCFVSTHLPPPPQPAVEAAIREAARGRGIVVLSGGEPTLSPDPERYIRLARAHGAAEIELQTNAIRLDQPGRAAALRDAGLGRAFVSCTAPPRTSATPSPTPLAPSSAPRRLSTRSPAPASTSASICALPEEPPPAPGRRRSHPSPLAPRLLVHLLRRPLHRPRPAHTPADPQLQRRHPEPLGGAATRPRPRPRDHWLRLHVRDPPLPRPHRSRPLLGLAAIPGDFDRGDLLSPWRASAAP
ncbi:MAG: radical SAM protein [Nannocystis sp.]|nr:radical SAM protein [Nannocystis sp.]